MGCSFRDRSGNGVGCGAKRHDGPRAWLIALLLASAPLVAQQVPSPPPEDPVEEESDAVPEPYSSVEDIDEHPEGNLHGQTSAQQAPPPKPSPLGIEWSTGDVKWKVGGYLKVDLIHDFQDIGNTDEFDVTSIPTGQNADNGANTRMHARQTRLNLDIRGPSSAGDFRIFIEGDFFGDGNSFRMRHAFGTIREFLAGQTWTTFMDEDAMPETLDFESPIAFPQVRTTQFRWTHPINDKGDYFAIAVEDPDSDITPPPQPGVAKEPWPDLTARLRLNNPIGHVQVGAFAGEARYEPDVGNTNDAALWGFNLATKLTTVDKDNAIVQFTFGDGVGRYRGGITAAPDASGNLEAVGVNAWTTAYQHFWSDEYRSNAGWSWAHGDIPSGGSPTSSERVEYGFVNLIWQFSERAWTGVEYLYGKNRTFDGNSGIDHRLQISVRMDL